MALLIGVPKETAPGEKRVATVPEVVEKLVKLGFAVAVESGAGDAARPCPSHAPGHTAITLGFLVAGPGVQRRIEHAGNGVCDLATRQLACHLGDATHTAHHLSQAAQFRHRRGGDQLRHACSG